MGEISTIYEYLVETKQLYSNKKVEVVESEDETI